MINKESNNFVLAFKKTLNRLKASFAKVRINMTYVVAVRQLANNKKNKRKNALCSVY